MKTKVAIAVLACLVSVGASAATFKCKDEKGATVYSDRACNGDEIKLKVPDFGARGSLKSIKVGMYEGEVQDILGVPDSVQTTANYRFGRILQWCYNESLGKPMLCVHFLGGPGAWRVSSQPKL